MAAMNIFLWVIQGLLALHTFVGAGWKLSHSEQTVPSLSALPHGVWLTLVVVELACGVGLLLPAIGTAFATAAPIAAIGIATEMLLFTGVHLASGGTNQGEIVYWLVAATLAALIAYGRWTRQRA